MKALEKGHNKSLDGSAIKPSSPCKLHVSLLMDLPRTPVKAHEVLRRATEDSTGVYGYSEKPLYTCTPPPA